VPDDLETPALPLPALPAEGQEWLVDAEGCEPAALRDRARLGAIFEAVIAGLGLRPVGEGQWHVFPGPGGVTGVVLLAESHLTVHTFPEHGTATFNLYCCRPRAPWPWETELAARLGARRVLVRSFSRGRVEG
jgi:S-adenosylmethionine decarboxylase